VTEEFCTAVVGLYSFRIAFTDHTLFIILSCRTWKG